ncbi:MAG: HAD family hydrolase [Bdellovibrionales bacterium]|nr:HAD family hydrolase [Bdellovibrionales bacterium]
MNKAIFFDRDGTLIIDKHYPNDPNQIEYFSDCFSTLKKLQNQGYLLFIVTNQSGVAKGLITEEQLEAIHEQMQQDFEKQNINIEEYFSAPYLPTSNHYYRKPNPGMLLEAINTYNINPAQSWMLGDKISDVEAGLKSGCKSILLSQTTSDKTSNYHTCKDLSEALKIIEQA